MRAVSIVQSRPSRSRRTGRAARGILTDWIGSLRPAERGRLFDRLIRADVALASALAEYARSPRVARMCLLLMNECAAARSVHVGELALLFPTLESEALLALQVLSVAERGAGRS
jgi:hypothetical protein